jgi:hypothetical protein
MLVLTHAAMSKGFRGGKIVLQVFFFEQAQQLELWRKRSRLI